MHWYVQCRNLLMCWYNIFSFQEVTGKNGFFVVRRLERRKLSKKSKKRVFFFWRKRWHDNSSIFETFQACVTFAASEGRIDEKFDKKIVRQKTCATRNDPTRAKTHLLPSQRDFGRLGQKVDHTAKFHATYLCMRFSRWHLSAAQKRLRKRVIF
jgi:hypothetical protein